jgi:hypothetical protein
MTAGKLGPHGAAVEAFLDEVRASPPERFLEVYEQSAANTGVLEATRGLAAVPMSAAVSSAVESATMKAFRSLGLRKEDFPPRLGVSEVATALRSAAGALAVGDALAPEHRRVLLAPFVRAGFASVAGDDAPAVADPAG